MSWYDPAWTQGKKTVVGALITALSGILPLFGLQLPQDVIVATGTLGGFLIVVGIAAKIDRK